MSLPSIPLPPPGDFRSFPAAPALTAPLRDPRRAEPPPAPSVPPAAASRPLLSWLKAHPVLLFVMLVAAALQAENLYYLWHPARAAQIWTGYYLSVATFISAVLGFYFCLRRAYPLKAFFTPCDYRWSLKVVGGYAAIGLLLWLTIYLERHDPETRAAMQQARTPIRPEFLRAFTTALGANDFLALARIFFLQHGLIFVVLIYPILEELLYQGLLFRESLKTLSPVAASCLVALLFALSHELFAEGVAGGIGYALFLFASRLFDCYVTRRSGSLLPAIVLHIIHNSFIASLGVIGHFFK